MEMTWTPVSAMARTRSRETLPLASRVTFSPLARWLASRISSNDMLSQHDDVGPGMEGLVEFRERRNFDLDFQEMMGLPSGLGDGVLDTTGGYDVVLLDEDCR